MHLNILALLKTAFHI